MSPPAASVTEARREVARTARMISAAGLAQAFGHVSARYEDGFTVTSVRPLRTCGPEDVLTVSSSGEVVAGPADSVPLELALHVAVYRTRPDIGAICRGHPPSVVAWGSSPAELPLLHGLGLLCGPMVRVHDELDLVTTEDAADAAVDTLGDTHCLILRGNGALACGADLNEAAVRLFFLEERAAVALAAAGTRFQERGVWQDRARHSDKEMARAVAWFISAFGPDAQAEGPRT